MASRVLMNGLFSILSIAIVGGIQYSALTELLSSRQEPSVQNHDFLTQVGNQQNTSTHTEQNTEQIKLMATMPALGFRNMLSNYAFVSFLQYFGDDEARRTIGYSDSAEYFSTVIHHDPYFKDFYVFLSGSSTLYAGMPEETVQIMSKGLASFREQRPDDSYYIWRYKGTDELLFLNDGKSAQSSFKVAADWALQIPGEEASAVAKISKQTANFLAENPDSQPAQISAWSNILSTALDDQTRNRAIEKIRELGGDVLVTEDGRVQITLSKAETNPDNRGI